MVQRVGEWLGLSGAMLSRLILVDLASKVEAAMAGSVSRAIKSPLSLPTDDLNIMTVFDDVAPGRSAMCSCWVQMNVNLLGLAADYGPVGARR